MRNWMIYFLLGLFAVLVTGALRLPQWAARNDTGLEAIGAAAMTFLIFATAATLLVIIMFALAIAARKSLNTAAILAGILPLPLIAAGLVTLFVLMRFA